MTQAFLSFVQESTYALQGTVTADAADGATTIAFSNISGSHTAVLPDMEIEFLRSSVITGRLRVRGSGTTSTSLHVEEFSLGRIKVLTGDTFRVIESWRIRHRLPRANDTFDVDYQTYTDEHENAAPLALGGAETVGYASDLSAVAHSASGRNIDIDSTQGHLGFSWAMPDSNTSSSASFTADYSGLATGTHWGSLVVTDTDNSKTTTRRKFVRVHGTGDEPYEVIEATVSGTPENSSTLSVTLSDTVDIDDVADGCRALFWSRNVGSAGTILYDGYLVRDSIRKDPDSETISFDLLSARGILEQLPGFSTVLESVADPDNWLEGKGVTVEDSAVYRFRELSTVLNTHDLELADISGLPFPLFYLQEQVPYAQVNELADAVDCLLTCTWQGKLRIVKPTWNMSAAERAAASTLATLNDDNVRQLDETREHRYPYSQVEGRGFAGDEPLFSRSPGNAPSEGAGKTVIERKIVINQVDLNERTGRYYARENRLKDGLPTRKSNVTVISSLWNLDPAYCDQWIILDNITTKRGVTHSNTRCSLESYSATWSADAEINPDISLELQEETDGVAGQTYTPPAEGETGIPPYEPPPYTPLPNPPDARLGGAVTKLAFFGSDNYVYITLNAPAFYPTWVAYALSVSGNIVDFVVDAFSPLYLNTGSTVNGYILTDSATNPVVYISDIFGATGSPRALTVIKTSLNAAASAAGRRRWMESNFGASGHLVVVSNYSSDGTYPGTWYTYSTDANDGSPTFSTETQITAHYNTNNGGNALTGIFLSSKAPGTGIVAAYTTTGLRGAAEASLYSLSSNYATVTQITTPSGYDPADTTPSIIVAPFHDNPSDAIVWFMRTVYSGPSAVTYHLKRKTGAGVDAANYAPIVDGAPGLAYSRRSFDACFVDRRRLVCVASNETVTVGGVFVSRNEGASWTEIDSTTTYRGAAIAGDNPDKIYLWGTGGAVAFVPDFETVYDRSGNIPTDYPSVGSFVGVAGG